MQAADAYNRLRIDGATRDLLALHPPLVDSVEFGHWLAGAGFAAGDALAARADLVEAKADEALGAFVNGVIGAIGPDLDGEDFTMHATAAELAATAIAGLSPEARRYIASGVYSRLRTMAERAGATLH